MGNVFRQLDDLLEAAAYVVKARELGMLAARESGGALALDKLDAAVRALKPSSQN